MFNVTVSTCLGNGCSRGCRCDAFDRVLVCAVLFYHEMSWMKSETELSQFLRMFPTYFSSFRM